MIYMNEVYVLRQTSDAWMVVNYVIMVPLLIFAGYFIFMELRQLFKSGLSYFTSFWNYLDFLPPILLYVFVILELNGEFDLRSETITNPDGTTSVVKRMSNQSLEASFQASMSLMLWIKFLYFFRIF